MILLIFLLSACVEKSVTINKTSLIRDYIVCGINQQPKDLTFFNREDLDEQELIVNLFEGLVKLDEAGKVIPAISESWTVNKEEDTYTFKIRSEAVWSDGRDITAYNFEEFFSQVLSKENNNIHAYKLYYIFGAENYNKGKVDFKQVAIKAIDKNTLQIKLNQPCSYFLKILSQPVFSLRKIDKSLLEYESKFKDISYTGAYKIVSYSRDEGIMLEKNPAYFNSGETISNKLLFAFTETKEGALAKFQTNKLDIFKNPPVREIEALKNKGYIDKKTMLNCDCLVFNLKTGNELAKNKVVRQAMAMAIDRSKIVSEVYRNNASVAKAYISPKIFNMENMGYSENSYYLDTSEEQRAKTLLEKNKISLKDKKIKIVYENRCENKSTIDIISKDFKKTFGVQIESQGASREELEQIKKAGTYDIILEETYAAYEYPTAILEQFETNSKMNFAGVNNTKLDGELYKIKTEKNAAKKAESIKKVEQLLLEESVVIPLYNKEVVICKKVNLEKVWVDKLGNMHFHKAFLNLNR